MAAFLYIEPATTFDLDIFITWKAGPGGLLTTLPLHDELKRRGYDQYEKDALLIEGWAVQFLPATTPLVEEALSTAIGVTIEGVPTRVLTKEFLMAICLETARPKDIDRLRSFIEEGAPDMPAFEKYVKRYNLSQQWQKMKQRLSPL